LIQYLIFVGMRGKGLQYNGADDHME